MTRVTHTWAVTLQVTLKVTLKVTTFPVLSSEACPLFYSAWARVHVIILALFLFSVGV